MSNRKRVMAIIVAMVVVFAFIPTLSAPASAASKSAKKLGKVTIKSVECVSANKVKIAWKKLPKNVKKYQIYKKAGSGKWVKCKTLSKAKKSWITKVKYGVKTSYKIRGINGKKKGKFSKAKSITIKKLGVGKTEYSIDTGNSANIAVKNAVGTVSYKSDDNNIARVSSNGVITGIKPGCVSITVANRGQKIYCDVYVNGYLDASNGYDYLNSFRIGKSVWQWNEDNKTKTYFNTNSDNTLESLARNEALENAAKIRAKEITKSFSHEVPEDSTWHTALPSDLGAFGENIAYGYGSIESATEAWKETKEEFDGQGHRRNMLEPDFNCVGIAGYMQDGDCYWVQNFGYLY